MEVVTFTVKCSYNPLKNTPAAPNANPVANQVAKN
jgi:hypothetical protein